MNRTILMIAAAVVLALGAALVIRALADEDSPSRGPEEAFREAERTTAAAYDCMPRDMRRHFDAAVRRYDARFGEVLDTLPDDADPREADQALRADPEASRLRTRARTILLDYVPGGDEFDRACYERAAKRYDRQVARGDVTR